MQATPAQLQRLASLRKRLASLFTEADIFEPLGYEPTAKQRLFHDATEFDVFYGGAAGGGKTKALVMQGIRDCMKFPGIRIGAFRRSFPELEESFIAELAAMGYAKVLGARWHETKHDLIFANGSLLMCRYAKSVAEATVRQGGQYQELLIDERTLIPPEVVEFLSSRIRSGRADIPVLGIRSAGNPGGPGHGDMKARYVEKTQHGTVTYLDERDRAVRFIPSRLADNPHLNPEYERDLDALPVAMRKAFKEGDWDSFVGQVFEEWNYDRHVVGRFAVPPEWRKLAGVDWGYAAPWCVLWGAVDPDGRVWVYREEYQTKMGETAQAKLILKDEDGETVMRYADPSMWRTTGEGPTIADTYGLNGCELVPANNERLAGWQQVHRYLSEGPACLRHRQQGWLSCPMLHVLEDTAPNLVRTLPTLPYDRAHPEDVDTDAEDHAGDALRYLCMGLDAGMTGLWFPEDDGPKTLDGRPPAVRIGGPEDAPTVVTPDPNAARRFVIGPQRAAW